MPYKGSSWSAPSRRRLLFGTLALAAMAAAGILAATAMPAFANGGGHGNGHGNGGGQAANHGNGHDNGGGGGGGGGGGQGNSGGGGHNNGGGNAGGNGHGATHVTICHATPPDTAANGYVMISPSASGVYHGHLREHAADIIPPFVYDGVTYSLNWDATGQAIWDNGCHVPGTTGGTNTNTTTTSTTTTSTTTTSTTTTSSATLGLSVVKEERVGATGAFSTGPVTATVGDTIFYEIFVQNTGDASLAVTLSDSHCDAGTLMPTSSVTLAPGAKEMYTCSHVLTSADGTVYYNVATASGYSAAVKANVRASSHVRANVTTSTGGVAAAHKTLKKVKHNARPSKAVVKAASYTG